MSERLFIRLHGDGAQGPEAGAPAESLRAFAVDPQLAPYVAHVLLYRESFAPGHEVIERVVPDGAMRLVFNFANAPTVSGRSGIAFEVVGASAQPAIVGLQGQVEGLSVTLRPGASQALLGLPAGALSEQALALDDIAPALARDLAATMAHAKSDEDRVAALSQGLMRHARRAEPASATQAEHIASAMARGLSHSTVRDVAAAAGVSERRLQQIFSAHVGLSPRTWARLCRLHACLRALRTRQEPHWADLAVSVGYFDQSHLANEFRSLCGLSPTNFLQMRASGSSKTSEGRLP